MRNMFLIILSIPIVLSAQNQMDKAIIEFDNKNYTKAETQFKAIVKQNPNHLKAYEYLGDTYAAQQEWGKAIDAFEYLVKKQPDNANFNFKYGGSLGMKAKNSNKFTALFLLDDVKQYLNKAADLDPNHIDVRWALLELYLELPGVVGGSVTKSKNYALQLQNISPVDGDLAFGRIADYEEDFKTAEKHYKNAVHVGGSKTCYSKLIDLYVKYKKPNKALDITKEAIQKLNSNDFNFKYAEMALNSNTNIDDGIMYIDRFIQNYNSTNYSLDKALVLKAKLHYNLGQFKEAKICLREALVVNPDSIQAKTELSRIEQL